MHKQFFVNVSINHFFHHSYLLFFLILADIFSLIFSFVCHCTTIEDIFHHLTSPPSLRQTYPILPVISEYKCVISWWATLIIRPLDCASIYLSTTSPAAGKRYSSCVDQPEIKSNAEIDTAALESKTNVKSTTKKSQQNGRKWTQTCVYIYSVCRYFLCILAPTDEMTDEKAVTPAAHWQENNVKMLGAGDNHVQMFSHV